MCKEKNRVCKPFQCGKLQKYAKKHEWTYYKCGEMIFKAVQVGRRIFFYYKLNQCRWVLVQEI